MRILGIDPGTLVMGYGVVEATGDSLALIEYGAFKTSGRSSAGERLSFLYREICRVIEKHGPDEVAVEQPFVATNARSALAIGRAQAVALLAGANAGLPCFEYTPAQVKQVVSGYGASDKAQIQQMVRMQLRLNEVPEPCDAADALAVAICHSRAQQWQAVLSREARR